METEKKIKIPDEIKKFFSQEYISITSALELFESNNPETKQFFDEILPIFKEWVIKNFPIAKMFF